MWDVPEPEVEMEDVEAEGDEEQQGQNGAGPVSVVPKVRLIPLDARQGSAVEVRSCVKRPCVTLGAKSTIGRGVRSFILNLLLEGCAA